ncbi:hypothetical protein [Streptomyces asoensis]|uniref:ComF family protein n=1 Tax=Streptomyces asoensis TaxID=249586 RepID=A0ABQ3RYV9_9ACTN|nr:hypothetical protein [Streptomyces asoensis]GGQ48634.1 hypothetical protein GCM10010496_08620 [Streptomyces asoensis]GHI61054.1 hypothetical protein Saso_27040 [Streptomyces asoensis]
MRDRDLDCPGCHGRRDPKLLVCTACWRALPHATRGRLARTDHHTRLRARHLQRELKAGTPLGIIRVPR